MSKIRILLWEDVLGVGGIEAYMCDLISFTDRDRYEMTLAVTNKTTEFYDGFLRKENVGVKLLLNERCGPIKRYILGVAAFKKYAEENKFDNVYFNCSSAADYLYVSAAKRCGVSNRLVHSHNSGVNTFVKRCVHGILKPLLSSSPTRRFACSLSAAEWLFPKKIIAEGNYRIISNTVDADRFIFSEEKRGAVRRELGYSDREFVIGHVGRFNIQKNHKFIIEVFRELQRKAPDSRLLLIGEGKLRSSIERKAEALGIADKICFFGISGRVNELMQAMDMFLFPSLYEGLGTVTVEAQASGLAVLCSDAVPPETRLTENIRYLPLRDGAARWAEEIDKIRRNGYERKDMSREIKARGYDCSSFGGITDTVYEGLG